MIAGEHESNSAEQTERLGTELAHGLGPGDVVFLSGELGAGKTTFVRGAARALGVGGPVTSPTFTVGQRYPATPPLAHVAHVDLYRIASLMDEDPDLLADYIGADTVTFIEWPEAAAAQLEPLLAGAGRAIHRVTLTHAGADRRVIRVGQAASSNRGAVPTEPGVQPSPCRGAASRPASQPPSPPTEGR